MLEAAEPLVIPRQRERVTNRDWRRHNANLALSHFADGTIISEGTRGTLNVSWPKHGGDGYVMKRWQVRGGQDFYPVWSHRWPHGGTACTALSQLIRYIQGRPVLPLSTWRYWVGEKVRLGGDQGEALLARLVHMQYPEHAACVLCGRRLNGLDWWNLNGVSGPCCGWSSGCRQKASEARP